MRASSRRTASLGGAGGAAERGGAPLSPDRRVAVKEGLGGARDGGSQKGRSVLLVPRPHRTLLLHLSAALRDIEQQPAVIRVNARETGRRGAANLANLDGSSYAPRCYSLPYAHAIIHCCFCSPIFPPASVWRGPSAAPSVRPFWRRVTRPSRLQLPPSTRPISCQQRASSLFTR
jgi:hypothetical protein